MCVIWTVQSTGITMINTYTYLNFNTETEHVWKHMYYIDRTVYNYYYDKHTNIFEFEYVNKIHLETYVLYIDHTIHK
mgnify:CR=1 FL=1